MKNLDTEAEVQPPITQPPQSLSMSEKEADRLDHMQQEQDEWEASGAGQSIRNALARWSKQP